MSKIKLIIAREYLSRVTKKTFLLVTILTPLAIGLIAVVAGYFALESARASKKIAILDDSGFLDMSLMQSKSHVYELKQESISEYKLKYADDGYDLLIHIPAQADTFAEKYIVYYYSKDKLSLPILESIESQLVSAFREFKIKYSGFDKESLERLDVGLNMENAMVFEENRAVESDKSSKLASALATGISYLMGFMMYMVIFIFGGMVMRSIMEEKINRIVEVMISTVKPFELMLGKVIGVGMVGLTQLAIWLLLIPIILFGVSSFIGTDLTSSASQMGEAQELLVSLNNDASGESITGFIQELKSMNWSLILPVFIIYFLGGYFIYASLFAAIGSAVGDDTNDSQQLMLPIIVPVILAIIMVPSVFSNPDGPVAIFGSMFPLFSPILMPARLPFEPPLWQIIVSVLIMLASVIFFVWLASRIYRVGIFMYGKKVSFKELGRWLFYKY